MFNRKFSSNMRRKKRMIINTIILLVVFLSVGYSAFSTSLAIDGTLNVSKYDRTLYKVLKDAANEGTYAKEYTGAHQDSMSGVGTEKIYHWYAPTGTAGDNLAEEIINKNNVIFADHCWKMIRTTDTGGVKMIYNGEVGNGQCLNTRGKHVGYAYMNTNYLHTTDYYGTSYTYDPINNVFSLAGTITTGAVKIGQYTCIKSSPTGTCENLYLVDSHNSGTTYNTIVLNSDAYYEQYGKIPFNQNTNSLAYFGYMYNNIYPAISKSQKYTIQNSSMTINTSWYYSNTIDYGNQNPNNYTLTNPVLISTLSDYSTLVGKYVLNSSSTYSTQARYIVAVSGTTIYYRTLSGGDLTITMRVGDSYTDNGNGTYSINNPTEVTYIDWYNGSYLTNKTKYVCDGTSATCTNIKHIANSTAKNYYYYCDVEHTYKYSESVNYNGGTYTLTGDIKEIWDIPLDTNQTTMYTHHYTCLNTGTTCTTVNYVFRYYFGILVYVELTGGEVTSTAINNMLNANGANQINSTIKTGIDAWYKRYMTGYTSQLEDTIYCNDRSLYNLGGWNPSGGSLSSSLQLRPFAETSDLSCINATDKFSISNSNAQLTYPVGLLTSQEGYLLNNKNINKTGQSYWLISPGFFDTGSFSYIVTNEGENGFVNVSVTNGVRPAISLKPGTEYVSGTGSMADPYIVDTYVYSISSTNPAGSSVSSLGTVYGSPEEAYTNFNKSVFLRHKIANNVVESTSLAFKKNGNYYYIQGGGATYNNNTNQYNEDSVYYQSNKEVLDKAFGSSNCTETSNPKQYTCTSADYTVIAFANGYVDGGGAWLCTIRSNGDFDCVDQ